MTQGERNGSGGLDDFRKVTGKYEPLRDHLTELAAGRDFLVELTFEEVDALVGGLPQSAYKWDVWWDNNSPTQSEAWRQAGWRVANVDLSGRRVRFIRAR